MKDALSNNDLLKENATAAAAAASAAGSYFSGLRSGLGKLIKSDSQESNSAMNGMNDGVLTGGANGQ